jgi:hypothetical protein
MAEVNANDRASLERVYPEDAFASDAAQNEVVPTTVRRGVRIGSAPDDSGRFELERAARHVGEAQTPDFLAPARRNEEPADPGRGYVQFLDDIVAAATRFGFRAEESPGQGDARIRGLRQ